MALEVYRLDESTMQFTPISVGTFDEPCSLGAKPGGSATVKKLFLKNDDDTKWYSGLAIRPKTTTNTPLESSVIRVKLLSGDSRPSEEDWLAALANEDSVLQSPLAGGPRTTRLPEIGEAGTADEKYYPFWIWAQAGLGAPTEGSVLFSLAVTYTENIV